MPDRPDLLARLTLVPTLNDRTDDGISLAATIDEGVCNAQIRPEKLRAPVPAANHLQRVQLLDRMQLSDAARLILVEAAAGFGKTTLLSQYRERCETSGRKVLWLTLDAVDNELRHLAAHLLVALQTLGEFPGKQKPIDFTAQGLLDRLVTLQQPFAIFLDDFETLESPPALDFVRRILASLPTNGLLVIASRTTPNLALGRLRAHGQLLDINTDSLRMSLTETTAFMRGKYGLTLQDREIAALQHRTEGWITALYMSALSLKGRHDPVGFVASLSSSSLELTHYLAEDILGRQPDDCREFLLQSSVLEHFNAALCNAVTSCNDSQAMIEYLQRANLFIQPVDEQHHWFRYHPLFADFLRRVLARQHPQQPAKLHAIAAHWYLGKHMPVAAIENFLIAGEADNASKQIDRYLDELIDAGRLRLLLRWFEQLPDEILDNYPRLVMTHAWTLVLDRRYQDAMQRIERQPANLQTDTIRCLLQVFTDQIDAAYTTGMTQIERLSPQDRLNYGLVATPLAYCMIATGRYAQARCLLTQMVGHGTQSRSTLVENIVICVESILDLIQGRLESAVVRLRTINANRLQNPGGKWTGGRPSLDILRALTCYEQDDFEQAQQILSDIPPNALDSGGPDPMIVRHVLLARIALEQGRRDDWVQQLAELEQLGRSSGSLRIYSAAWLERARVATLENRPDSAAQALHNAELAGQWDRPDLLLYSCDVDTPFIACQRLRIFNAEHASAVSALGPAIAEALERQHNRRALKLRLLFAMALEGLGRHKQALETLTPALCLASKEGFVRTFIDEGLPLAKLLQRWAVSNQAQCKSLDIDPPFLTQLLQRSASLNAQAAAQDEDPDAALTTRELHVMQLLAAGNRNRAIAEQMHLSEHTVKTHLRNISAKLGAQGRTEIIAIARAKGLLD
ncbi:LuxR C-terminal-related transcriptional regulator [Pseudomonas fluorescens]|uniref:HTH-type transcriptional regulator MalT n=1 Tax=Pseudomonas fluorescens TaxID=294 RepID=A0A5E6QWL6_PSEFL|nr:LuxR C-terminal-related transcriptional regulator [Pseudomonas fluorescens]VVM58751.1 HTH-type transcriptional regulator MalT [Pseudomonas fluorescens]